MSEGRLKGRASPFRTPAGDEAYLAFVNGGPLSRIFADERLRLAPAKGAREYRERFPDVFDQTYFAHAMNVSITAGLLFEAASPGAPAGAATAQELRIVLAAGALHDFNKLRVLAGERGLSRALEEKAEAARPLVAGYVADTEVEDVFHLALDTEGGSSKDSSRYGTTVAPRRLTLMAWCLQLADQLAGTDADPNDAERYRGTVEKFRAGHPMLPEIHVQPFALVPQAAVARAARQTFLDWVRDRGALLHESERYVTWIGEKPTAEDLEALTGGLWERVVPSPEAAFDKAGVAPGSVKDSWTRFVDPTPEVIDRWIEAKGRALVVWQGDWGARHFDALTKELPGVFQYEPKGNKVRVELTPKDEAAGEVKARERALAKLVIAHCVHQFLSAPRTVPEGDPAPFEVANLEGVMSATVPGILWARADRDDPDAYPRTLEALSALLRRRRAEASNPVRGFFQTLLGHPPLPRVGPTGKACVYCGVHSNQDVQDALVFGIKPTAWAPRKKGIQRETHHGAICDLCILENQLRDSAARASNAPGGVKEFLTAHVHAADLVCDVKWETFTPLLTSPAARQKDRVLLLFPKTKKGEEAGGQVVPLRGHYSVPMPKPAKSNNVGETLAHLFRLRDCLRFVRLTGFKLHVSPLALVPAQERAQLRWTNPPAWMEHLGLAEVHVDDLQPRTDESGSRRPSAAEIVDALFKAGNATGGSQGHRTFISRLVRNPLAVYDFPDLKETPKGDGSHFIEILEDAYVAEEEKASLAQAALAYIHFNARGEWSNNTWTWATRHYLDLRERYRGEPDWRSLVTGDLWAAAQRKNTGATIEKVEAFAYAMEDYLARFRGGMAPIGADQRVLINAVAFQARKLYRTVYPKEETA